MRRAHTASPGLLPSDQSSDALRGLVAPRGQLQRAESSCGWGSGTAGALEAALYILEQGLPHLLASATREGAFAVSLSHLPAISGSASPDLATSSAGAALPDPAASSADAALPDLAALTAEAALPVLAMAAECFFPPGTV